MKFITTRGSVKNVKNSRKYLIDWEAQSKSKFQKRVKDFLCNHWSNDVVFEEFPVAGTRMRFDFFNLSRKVVVEAQGGQHTRHVKFFHGRSKIGYGQQIKRDILKIEFCEANDIQLVEIYDDKELTKEFFKQQGVIL